MSRISKVCGVILAAGESSRMGREKALLPWPPVQQDVSATGQTLLSACIESLKPFTDAIVVVAGKNADKLAESVYANGATMVRNPAPERGQFSSMQVGLSEALAHGYDTAMITLVDCPPLSRASLDLLCTSFNLARAQGKWAVAPANSGKHGHPLLAGRELIEAFLQASAASNARRIKHMFEDSIEYIDVADSLVSIDVNTPEQYAALSMSASRLR